MKKNKLALGLVSSLVGILALSACSYDVTSSKDNIVTFKGYDGNEIGIITDAAYNEYLNSPSGISKFYDAIMETLIRYEFQYEGSSLYGKTDKSYEEIEQDAKRQVKSAKDDAKEAADENGTTYDDEWKSKLESEGVETEKELLEKYIYAGEKDQAEDWYFDEHREQLTAEYLGVDKDGNKVESKVSAMYPYHIRHILVKVGSGSNNFTKGTITENESLNLSTAVKALVDGKLTFGNIAQTYSEDTGSAAKYGDVGIMTTETSFVNEFKLGIYAYDAVLSGKTNATISNGLGLEGAYQNTTVKAKVASIGLTYVPYGAFEAINEYKDVTKSTTGYSINNGSENYYPRNIYWNKYLNHHNPFVISNNQLAKDDVQGITTAIDNTILAAAEGKCGFRSFPGITTGEQKILTDEAGRPIIGVRSEHGIHLMIMQKSIFDFNNGEGANVSLEQYYTTLTPNEDNYPEHNGVDKATYVNYIDTADQSTLNTRAEEVENAIKTFDPTYNYRLYEHFVESGDLVFKTNEGIYAQEQIENYIEFTRNTNAFNDAKTINQAWRTYLELLDQQTAERIEERLVPEMCAINFKKAYNEKGEIIDPEFKEGGKCYYAN